MPATVIPVTGMQLGFVGQISSEGYSLRVPRQVKPTDTNNIAFGEAVVVNSDNTVSSVKTFIANGGTLTASVPLGIAVSNVHTNGVFPVNGGSNASAGYYAPGQIADILVVGTVNVAVAVGTPSGSQGTVYVRKTVNGGIPAGTVGDFEAAADGTNTVALTNVVFKTGYLESDGTAQVTILNRTIA